MDKTSSRFRQTGIAPKANARLPFAHRGWDVSVTLEHGTKAPKHVRSPKTECGCALCVDKYEDWRGERLPRGEGNRRAIAEELAHAREIADMEAISEDELDLAYLDSVGRDWYGDGNYVLDVIERAEYWGDLLDEAHEEAEDEFFITYAELMQAPTEVRMSEAFVS